MKPYLPSRCEQIDVRGLRYNVRHWGAPGAPKLFMLHGWMDASATFQFVVDALTKEWHVIAPDWRGYGASQWLQRPYWFPDYYADLEALLAHYSPAEPARVVGHSMGASIASMVAGVRTQRIAQLVMLDFLGLPAASADEAPGRIGEWLDEVNTKPRLRSYPDPAALAARLMQSNARLSAERAGFLARTVGRLRADGRVEMACDPWHRVPSPMLYRIEEAMACWRAITIPVLHVFAEHGYVHERFAHLPEEHRRRIECFAKVEETWIADAGHNLQHDQPEKIAAEIERFIKRD
jgi:pimeloyl-ACP methyl ester carboxylesterase